MNQRKHELIKYRFIMNGQIHGEDSLQLYSEERYLVH